MNLQTALEYLNDNSKIDKHYKHKLEKWRAVYYGMSLHTTGACPKFRSLDNERRDFLGNEVCPAGYYGEEYQFLFDRILFSRHPREHELTRQWRFSQYKPLTKAAFQQITEIVIGAIFQDSQYDIQIQNKDEDQYIWTNSFEGHDLIGWYANIGVPSIMEDPNGLIIRMPKQPFYDLPAGKIDIGIYFIKSKDIIYPPTPSDQTLIFKREQYAYYVDVDVIYRFSRDGDKWILTPEDAQGYYSHMFGRLPIDVAGGIWNTQGFYDSYLDKAKAAADDYITSYSAEQMVDKEASHPFIIMANEECGECNGIGSKSQPCDDCEGGFELAKCRVCGGKGTVSVSPGDRLYAKKEDMENDMVKIVNPDVAINTYHHDKNKDIMEAILAALHLLITEQAQSGVAKAIDQQRLHQFISKISNNLFDRHIYNTISDLLAYRNVGVINGSLSPINTPFSIQKPTQFQIKTAADLLEEFKTGTEAQMPSFMRSKMLTDFIDKQYAGDDLMKKKSEIIMQLDDLSLVTPDERLSMATANEITNEDVLFSRKLPLILDEIIREKGHQWFLESDFDSIENEVSVKFEEIKSNTSPIDLINPAA